MRPALDETYDSYQFFADDPDGRAVEFQTFLHPADEVWTYSCALYK